MEPLKVAVLQISLDQNDFMGNMKKIQYTIENLNEQLDILCLPELAVEGYNLKRIRGISQSEISTISNFFKKLARENGVYLFAGQTEILNNNYYDSIICYNPEGKIENSYRKIHLWGDENSIFKSGNTTIIIDIKGWKIGLGICADLGFPELSRRLVLNGAEVLLFSSAWAKPYTDLWKLMAKSRAAENQAFLIASNKIGIVGNTEFCGNSLAVNPKGEIINNLLEEEGCFVIELNKDELQSRRCEIPWLKMLKPTSYK